jgi:hypothetical protein
MLNNQPIAVFRSSRFITCFALAAVTLLVISSTGCAPSGNNVVATPVGSVTSRVRCGNGLTTQDAVLNAISANRTALDLLVSNPLATETFALTGPDPLHEYYALGHNRARRFMAYLVNCALRGDQVPVEGDNPFPPFEHYVFKGGIGLCPEWQDGPFPLSDACLERVGACVYGARVNPEGKRVPISIRGENQADTSMFPLSLRTPTDVHRQLSPVLVQSFRDCAVPTSGEVRDCGWAPALVGSCTAGQVVAVSAGAPRVDTCAGPPLGSGTLPNVLRVCDGIYGCDFGDASHLGSSLPGACAGFPGPGVVFTCRSSGNFSVMVGPLTSGDPSDAVPDAANADRYPAREIDAFPLVEMAVYGNPFKSARLNERVLDITVDPCTGRVENENQVIPIQAGPIFLDMWSCYARQWNSAAAYLAHRLCGIPGLANCAAQSTGVCYISPTNGQCEVEHGTLRPEAGDFERCRDGSGNTRLNPLTTYLNQQCDALTSNDRDFCTRNGRTTGNDSEPEWGVGGDPRERMAESDGPVDPTCEVE